MWAEMRVLCVVERMIKKAEEKCYRVMCEVALFYGKEKCVCVKRCRKRRERET